MKKLIIISIAAIVMLVPIAGKASTMEIKITGGFTYGIRSLEIDDGANKSVDVRSVNDNGSQAEMCSGTTDNNGKYSNESLQQGDSIGASSLEVIISTETWKGITVGGKYVSEEQKEAAKKKKAETQSLLFDSFGSFFSYDGNLCAQVQVINLDTDYAYEFPSLQIYADLDESYFETDDFDSSEAIATGHQVSDVIIEMGRAGVSKMEDTGNIITVPSGIVNNPQKYVLLTGTAHKIDGDGNPVGSDIGFSIAIIPEPATIALLTLGSLAILRKKRL